MVEDHVGKQHVTVHRPKSLNVERGEIDLFLLSVLAVIRPMGDCRSRIFHTTIHIF
jgi:hypothetical protein